VLGALGRRVPLALVSSTPDGELRQIVERRDLARYFRAVRGAPPAKAVAIRDVVAAFRWSADRVAMVGDTTADMEAARANGLSFVGRIAPGRANPFPPGIPTIPDLEGLAETLMSLAAADRERAKGTPVS
jgi:phosphoglycolate phosphatase-like HAD superfamily hydrolase